MTLIGTPPNLIVSDTLASAGFGSLGFFSFLPVGLVTLSVGILYLLPATRMLAPKDKVKDGKDAGLFYHAPDVPFVWGRGAGWMAAGMPAG